MIKMQKLLSELSKERPIFHSEADFQHAFAWIIHIKNPELSVRLEKVVRNANGDMHIDLFLKDKEHDMAMELKYKTRGILTDINGEKFHLADQAAQDLGRYDFFKDVQRLERLSDQTGCKSMAVFLTNDSAYWKPPRDNDVGYAEFSMEQGRMVRGRLQWGARAGEGTRRTRESPIDLAGSYKLDWIDYSTVRTNRWPRFRFVIAEVRK